MEAFTNAVAKFDQITRLDAWKTAVLLRARSSVLAIVCKLTADGAMTLTERTACSPMPSLVDSLAVLSTVAVC